MAPCCDSLSQVDIIRWSACKSYDFQTRKWVESLTNNEVSSDYWEHYNNTYFFPSYPLVQKQLAFLFYDVKVDFLKFNFTPTLGKLSFTSRLFVNKGSEDFEAKFAFSAPCTISVTELASKILA